MVVASDRYRAARMRELNTSLAVSESLAERLREQRAVLRRANVTLEMDASITGYFPIVDTVGCRAAVLETICEIGGGNARNLDTGNKTRMPALFGILAKSGAG